MSRLIEKDSNTLPGPWREVNFISFACVFEVLIYPTVLTNYYMC
jgi:hypothetical protein